MWRKNVINIKKKMVFECPNTGFCKVIGKYKKGRSLGHLRGLDLRSKRVGRTSVLQHPPIESCFCFSPHTCYILGSSWSFITAENSHQQFPHLIATLGKRLIDLLWVPISLSLIMRSLAQRSQVPSCDSVMCIHEGKITLKAWDYLSSHHLLGTRSKPGGIPDKP